MLMIPNGYPMPRRKLSVADTRRITLAAQGFDRPRLSRRCTSADLRDLIRRLGLIQIDYVNVLTPAQYQVPFSRLGSYPRAMLDATVYGPREFTEQWAHEACILPVETWPLLRHRMEVRPVRPWGFEKFMAEHADYAAMVLEEVRKRGPLAAADLPDPPGRPRRIDGAWWNVPRAALEAHFGRGLLATVNRSPAFVRIFDLAERAIPARHFTRRIEREEAQRELLRQAAREVGVATAADLADYYRMPLREARPRIAELVAGGEVREVAVDGWREPAFLHREAKTPKRVDAAALISPFDPLIFFRPRVKRLFALDYRVEIWVPQAKRRWGYYVLPFLLGDRLVARVDLKADRARSRLSVPGAWIEPGCDVSEVAPALSRELRLVAGWLDLDGVDIAARGAFAARLRRSG